MVWQLRLADAGLGVGGQSEKSVVGGWLQRKPKEQQLEDVGERRAPGRTEARACLPGHGDPCELVLRPPIAASVPPQSQVGPTLRPSWEAQAS